MIFLARDFEFIENDTDIFQYFAKIVASTRTYALNSLFFSTH